MKKLFLFPGILWCFSLALLGQQTNRIEILSVTEVTHASVRILAHVSGEHIEERGIGYSLKPKTADPEILVSYGTGSFGGFSCQVSELQPATDYYMRAYARVGNANFYGEEIKITTREESAPTVRTLSVSEIRAKSARIQGRVIGTGILECGVYFSRQLENVKKGECVPIASNGFGNYSVKLSGLHPDTPYFAVFYARCAGGIVYGEVIRFETLVTDR